MILYARQSSPSHASCMRCIYLSLAPVLLLTISTLPTQNDQSLPSLNISLPFSPPPISSRSFLVLSPLLPLPSNHPNFSPPPHVGVNEGLDLAIYSKRSLFASARRLRDSSRATTNVAEVEFLQLLGLLPAPRSSHRPNLLTATAAEGDESGEVEEAATTA